MVGESLSEVSARDSSVPPSAPESSPALAVPQAALLAFLQGLDRRATSESGMLVFGRGGVVLGRIVFTKGRICWASAENMRSRLTELLRHQHEPPLDPHRVEEAYAQCVERRQVFGEYLVESGVVSAAGLRRALRQHIAESIALLSDSALDSEWYPREGNDYEARFTFSTGDLLTNLGALWDVEAACEARARLRRLASSCAVVGLGFVSTSTHVAVPVAKTHTETTSATELLTLASWVNELPRLLPSHFGRPSFASYKRGDGHTALGWNEGPLGFAVVCSTPSAFNQVVSRVFSVG